MAQYSFGKNGSLSQTFRSTVAMAVTLDKSNFYIFKSEDKRNDFAVGVCSLIVTPLLFYCNIEFDDFADSCEGWLKAAMTNFINDGIKGSCGNGGFSGY